jgi:hypothetical protein
MLPLLEDEQTRLIELQTTSPRTCCAAKPSASRPRKDHQPAARSIRRPARRRPANPPRRPRARRATHRDLPQCRRLRPQNAQLSRLQRDTRGEHGEVCETTIAPTYAHIIAPRLTRDRAQEGPSTPKAAQARANPGPFPFGLGFDREQNGAPGRIRTCDPRLRRPSLYPAELRGLAPAFALGSSVLPMAAGRRRQGAGSQVAR